MTIGFTHKAVAHLVAAILAGDTEIAVHSTEYGQVLASSEQYVFLMLRGPVYRELVKVDIGASVWGSYLKVVRGQGGTPARGWPLGSLLFATTHEDHYNSIIQAAASRTIDYNPNEILTPLYAGEKIYQDSPAGCERWWKSFNGVDAYWDIITGEACSLEAYEDIGWNYDILILGDPWSFKKSMYAESSSIRWVLALVYYPPDNALFLGTDGLGQIWKSTDGGDTWALNVDLGALGVSSIDCLIYDSYNDVLVAGTGSNGKVYRSTDGGDNWTDEGYIGSELEVWSGAFDSNSNVLVVGTFNNAMIYKSTDGGDNWVFKKDISAEPNGETHVLAMCFDSTRNRLIAGTGLNDGEIYVSTDAGETWTFKKDLSLESPAQGRIYSMCYDSYHDVILVGTYSYAQIWKSTDGGETWSLSKDLRATDGQYTVRALLYNPDNHWIFAGTEYDAQIWVSKDGAVTWELDQELGSSLYGIYSFAYDPYHSKNVAGIGNNIGSPGGQIWTRGNV